MADPKSPLYPFHVEERALGLLFGKPLLTDARHKQAGLLRVSHWGFLMKRELMDEQWTQDPIYPLL